MKEEELIKKLENAKLPKADMEDHRLQLRAALMAGGHRARKQRKTILESVLSGLLAGPSLVVRGLRSPQPAWRVLTVSALALVIIIGLAFVVPLLNSESPAARAAKNIALESPKVQAALGGERASVVSVKEGATSVVILEGISSRNRVVVYVDMNSRMVTSTFTVGTGSTATSGSTGSPVVINRLTDDGPDTVFLSADSGLLAISKGKLQWSAPFAGEPRAVIDDVTGDGAGDVVVSGGGSSVRCYNGMNGEEVWQFDCGQRRVFEHGLGWIRRGLSVEGIQVLRAGDSQIVAARSDRYVFGIDAQGGEQTWKFKAGSLVCSMARVCDLNNDGVEELAVGTRGGHLYLVNGSTGKAEWKKKIGVDWVEVGDVRHGAIKSIATFDDRSSEAVIVTSDERVCLIDLSSGNLKWENQVAYREVRSDVQGWLVPDVTGDGLPEILVNKGFVSEAEETSTTPGGGMSIRRPLRIAVLLSGADGSEVWETSLYLEGSLITRIDSQSVLLEPHPQLGIRVISLKDGNPLKSFTISGLGSKASRIEEMSDGGYLVSSKEGNLVAISSAGEVQWCYSRLSNIRVDKGQFTSDAVPDLLVSAEAGGADGIRQVSVLDGTTRRELWSYDVPWLDAATAGGLSGVQAVDDLTEDGIQDVIAYRGSTIFRFSGADGSLAQFDIGESITFLQPTKTYPGPAAILAGTEDGLVILDKDGNKLWESAYTDWSDAELGAVRVLNDLNQDGVSDLMMQFADRVVVARSAGTSPLNFETHLSIPAGENRTFEFKNLTGDIDGDGVQEIAYFEHDKAKDTASSVLLVVSPVSGKVWHQWNMPVTVGLACADFNGDGFRDSLIYHPGPKVPTAILTTASTTRLFGQAKLEVYSGKGGSILWSFTFDADWWNAGSEKMPAAPAGDITGDGVEDLAVSSVTNIEGTANSSSGSCSRHETRVSVYNILNDSLVKEVVSPPVQKDSGIMWSETHNDIFQPVSGPGDAMRLAGDLNGDGYQEMAVLASYDVWSTRQHRLALVDLHNEKLLGYCNMLSTLDFFETNENYTVGFTSGSSVYLAEVISGLQVTWPGEGATVGSPARIAWEGMGESSTVTVFVDGYENARTNDSEVTLPLKPGKHEVVIRSVDGFGIVTYAAVDFKVKETPWASMLAVAGLIALLLVYFSARWIRMMRNRRAEREAA